MDAERTALHHKRTDKGPGGTMTERLIQVIPVEEVRERRGDEADREEGEGEDGASLWEDRGRRLLGLVRHEMGSVSI